MEVQKIHWQNTGGSSSRLKIDGKDRIIKPNEKFMAFEWEVSKAFRDILKPIDGSVLPAKEGDKIPEQFKGKKPEYTVKQRESGITIEPKGKSKTWFNVVKEGNELNVKALNKTDAENLKVDLEKDALWDVLDSQDKALNDKGLKKEIAEKFKADLEK